MKKKENPRNAVPQIDLSDDDFGAVLNCAVRYCLGRRTYMPSLVTEYIRPLIPFINNKTLIVFQEDIDRQRSEPAGYGDPHIDEPVWASFRNDVQQELTRRYQAGGKNEGHKIF